MPNNDNKQKLVAEARAFMADDQFESNLSPLERRTIAANLMADFANDVLTAERSRVCEWERFDEDYPQMCDGGEWQDHVSIPPFCCICGGKVKITEAQ